MLVDFFVGVGIPKGNVFCSSLPGTDVREKIFSEIKTKLKKSVVDIAILSRDYYQSAYCLNEAGIFWYKENTTVIPIALPEINHNSMCGFLNNEYKLHRLDLDVDISSIYDIVQEKISVPQMKTSILTAENRKLRKRYAEYIRNRKTLKSPSIRVEPDDISSITTDDERIILYYILQKNVRRVCKSEVSQWLIENEIYDVNVDNAFDLLASFDDGKIEKDVLELGINIFRKYSARKNDFLLALKGYVDQHTKLAIDTFRELWQSGSLELEHYLFAAYIVDKKRYSFGDRWMAEAQVQDIKQWEEENIFDNVVSDNYVKCLDFFVRNDLVYESEWTSHGNPRAYRLQPSLQKLFDDCPKEILEEVQKIKDESRLF